MRVSPSFSVGVLAAIATSAAAKEGKAKCCQLSSRIERRGVRNAELGTDDGHERGNSQGEGGNGVGEGDERLFGGSKTIMCNIDKTQSYLFLAWHVQG